MLGFTSALMQLNLRLAVRYAASYLFDPVCNGSLDCCIKPLCSYINEVDNARQAQPGGVKQAGLPLQEKRLLPVGQ